MAASLIEIAHDKSLDNEKYIGLVLRYICNDGFGEEVHGDPIVRFCLGEFLKEVDFKLNSCPAKRELNVKVKRNCFSPSYVSQSN